ncbi:hypothetical protein H2204_014904 [Knufia peltigerae]|uniref:Ankyrin repeat protein n=1 Tax=Knufia peltigerae TaxID=1002370 RepID=A0AA39CKV4_9EURO|nr:hypothetical protein H2204_014904 [Knufia peltigerae]
MREFQLIGTDNPSEESNSLAVGVPLRSIRDTSHPPDVTQLVDTNNEPKANQSLTVGASLSTPRDASYPSVTDFQSEAGKMSIAIARRLFMAASRNYEDLGESLASEVWRVALPEKSYFISDMELVAYYPGVADLPVLMSYLVYICSNHLIQRDHFDNLADNLLSKYGIEALRYSCIEQLQYLRSFQEFILLYAARKGRYEIVRFLRPFLLDLDQRLRGGAYPRTLLHEAVVHKQTSFGKALLDDGADAGCPMAPSELQVFLYDRPAMDLAAYFAPELFRHMLDISRQKSTFNPALLLPLAAKSGMIVTECLQLLELGANVNAMDSQGWTALQHAVSAQQHSLVCTLLDHGASTDLGKENRAILKRYQSLESRVALPLSLGIESNDVEMCEILLRAGADVNDHLFTTNGDLLDPYYKQLLLEDLPRGTFQTALQRAVWENNTQLIQLLLEQGAKPTVESTIPCIIIAVWRNNYEALALLIQHGANLSETYDGSLLGKADAMVYASYGGDLRILHILIRSGVFIEPAQQICGKVWTLGWTPLQAACLSGNAAVAQLLLASGADVNAPCFFDGGLTALQAAIRCRNMALVNLLLNWGANVNASPSRYGDTVLSAAIKSGSMSVLRHLIAHGADVTYNGCNYRHGYDESMIPTVAAAILGRIDFIQEMLQAGLNLQAPIRQNTPSTILGEALSRAARYARIEVIEWFLQHTVTLIPLELSEILFSIHFYQKFDREASKKFTLELLDRGADANAFHSGETRSPTTILSRICFSRKENKELVQLLLDRGVDVDPDPGCDTKLEVPLIGAVRNGHIAIVELLLEYGANPNTTSDAFRWTPLQHAASQGYIRIAQILLAHGADVGALTSDGQYTALDLAVTNGRFDMVKLLLDNYKLGDCGHMSRVCQKYAEVAREECQWAILKLLESYQSEAQHSDDEIKPLLDAEATETGTERSRKVSHRTLKRKTLTSIPG